MLNQSHLGLFAGTPGAGNSSRGVWRAIATIVALFGCGGITTVLAGPPSNCGGLETSYGPFDYRTQRAELVIVERFHFTFEVESLVRGKSGHIGQDLEYTLKTSPNHHRALLSMARYGEKLKVSQVPQASYEVECYFVRATRFKPDDTTVRMLYANFLKNQKRPEEAVRQLDIAAVFISDFGFTHYNLGLSYLDLGVWEKALHHAQVAQQLGFTRTDLKDKLIAAGQWAEPQPGADAAAAAASGASR